VFWTGSIFLKRSGANPQDLRRLRNPWVGRRVNCGKGQGLFSNMSRRRGMVAAEPLDPESMAPIRSSLGEPVRHRNPWIQNPRPRFYGTRINHIPPIRSDGPCLVWTRSNLYRPMGIRRPGCFPQLQPSCGGSALRGSVSRRVHRTSAQPPQTRNWTPQHDAHNNMN
jgi:hypothetical protein